jgi:hypothetical protein
VKHPPVYRNFISSLDGRIGGKSFDTLFEGKDF